MAQPEKNIFSISLCKEVSGPSPLLLSQLHYYSSVFPKNLHSPQNVPKNLEKQGGVQGGILHTCPAR
jgi:hypothetical protein